MDRKTVRAIIEAGAVKKVFLIASGGVFYAEIHTPNDKHIVSTGNGQMRTWRTVDAAAKWMHTLGVGECILRTSKWQPDQRSML